MEKYDNPYMILYVLKDAEQSKIKSNYRKLALRHHPDRMAAYNPEATEAEKKTCHDEFAKISAAYDMLTDPVKKRDWDLAHRDWDKSRNYKPPTGIPPAPKRKPRPQSTEPNAPSSASSTRSTSSNDSGGGKSYKSTTNASYSNKNKSNAKENSSSSYSSKPASSSYSASNGPKYSSKPSTSYSSGASQKESSKNGYNNSSSYSSSKPSSSYSSTSTPFSKYSSRPQQSAPPSSSSSRRSRSTSPRRHNNNNNNSGNDTYTNSSNSNSSTARPKPASTSYSYKSEDIPSTSSHSTRTYARTRSKSQPPPPKEEKTKSRFSFFRGSSSKKETKQPKSSNKNYSNNNYDNNKKNYNSSSSNDYDYDDNNSTYSSKPDRPSTSYSYVAPEKNKKSKPSTSKPSSSSSPQPDTSYSYSSAMPDKYFYAGRRKSAKGSSGGMSDDCDDQKSKKSYEYDDNDDDDDNHSYRSTYSTRSTKRNSDRNTSYSYTSSMPEKFFYAGRRKSAKGNSGANESASPPPPDDDDIHSNAGNDDIPSGSYHSTHTYSTKEKKKSDDKPSERYNAYDHQQKNDTSYSYTSSLPEKYFYAGRRPTKSPKDEDDDINSDNDEMPNGSSHSTQTYRKSKQKHDDNASKSSFHNANRGRDDKPREEPASSVPKSDNFERPSTSYSYVAPEKPKSKRSVEKTAPPKSSGYTYVPPPPKTPPRSERTPSPPRGRRVSPRRSPTRSPPRGRPETPTTPNTSYHYAEDGKFYIPKPRSSRSKWTSENRSTEPTDGNRRDEGRSTAPNSPVKPKSYTVSPVRSERSSESPKSSPQGTIPLPPGSPKEPPQAAVPHQPVSPMPDREGTDVDSEKDPDMALSDQDTKKPAIRDKPLFHDPFEVFDRVMKEEFCANYDTVPNSDKAEKENEKKSSGTRWNFLKRSNKKQKQQQKQQQQQQEEAPRREEPVSVSMNTKTLHHEDGRVEVKTITKILRPDGTIDKVVQSSIAQAHEVGSIKLPNNSSASYTNPNATVIPTAIATSVGDSASRRAQ